MTTPQSPPKTGGGKVELLFIPSNPKVVWFYEFVS